MNETAPTPVGRRPRGGRWNAVAFLTAVVLVVMSPGVGPAAAAPDHPFPGNAPADYQLGGAYPPAPGVTVVVRDRTEPPGGAYPVCYVNAFQTQPGDAGWWQRRHPRLLLRDGAGRLVADREWPGEYLLDIRSADRRHALAQVVGRWMRGCARAGFVAVEPDNLDSWTRSRGLLQARHAVAYSRLLVRRAHALGLAIEQKNAVELVSRRVGWDFAVAEECQVYDECAAYRRVHGNAMIEIEYADAGGRSTFRAACRARGAAISVVYADRDLVAWGDPAYVRDEC